jgi:hypothetical protein
MDSRGLYDDDIYAWSEQQAAVLRSMSRSPGRLPNDLDLEHVAEEIEDLGRSERHAAESALRLIMVHLIKIAAAPHSPAVRHWRKEIVSFQIELASRLTQSMAQRIDMDRLWHTAKREARAGLEEDEAGGGDQGLWAVARCPIDLRTLQDEDLEVDRVVARLRSDT